MAHTVHEDAQFLSLPVELLENILARIQAPDLKALRQTSKFLQRLSTPRLYAKFTLFPHVRSFERLLSIAESDSLRLHVQHLEYDTGYLGLTDRFIRRLQTVWSSEIPADEKKKAIEHAQTINSQKMRADVALDNLAQLDYLERAFARLVNLRHIVVEDSCEHLDEGFTREELPSFYRQLAEETCGRFPHTRLEHGTLGVRHVSRATYTHAVMIAAGKLPQPLEHLELYGLNWQNFLQQGTFSKFTRLPELSMAGLRTLHLCAEGAGYFPDSRAMANLQTLLRAAVNLEKLVFTDRWCDDIRLYGPHLIDDDIGTTCNSMFQPRYLEQASVPIPAQLIWSSKLKYLDLYGITISSKEFKNVLKPCCETLEFISLGNMMLMPEDFTQSRGLETPRACWVNMFKWMQRHLKSLKSVNIASRLTNGGMQHWLIGHAEREPNPLRTRVYEFLLKGGPCPLEHVSIKPGDFDLKKKKWKGDIPEILETDEYAGDESWQMEYNDESDLDSDLNDDELFDAWEVESDFEDEDDDDEWGDDGDDILPVSYAGLFPHMALTGSHAGPM